MAKIGGKRPKKDDTTEEDRGGNGQSRKPYQPDSRDAGGRKSGGSLISRRDLVVSVAGGLIGWAIQFIGNSHADDTQEPPPPPAPTVKYPAPPPNITMVCGSNDSSVSTAPPAIGDDLGDLPTPRRNPKSRHQAHRTGF